MAATKVLFSIFYALGSSTAVQLQDCPTPCTCQARAAALADDLKAKLDSATTTAAANAKQALQLAEAAASANGEKKKFLAPVAAIALGTITKDAEALKEATPTITKAIETFTAAAAHYSLVATLAVEVTAAALDASGSSHYVDATVTAPTIPAKIQPTCSGEQDEKAMTEEAKKMPDDLKFKQTDLHMAIQITCARSGPLACNGAVSGNKIKTKASFSSTKINKEDGTLSGGEFKPIATGPILKQQTLPATINAEAASIKAAINKLEQIKPLTDSDVFTNNGKLREYIKTQIYNLQPADKEQPPVATQISEHISKNYGADSIDFPIKFEKQQKTYRSST
uniref:Variant surface glycoprotein 1646 n=1 Tax=Trypanosoma brucei TaxID=5691 RepID=M4SYZ0_9TRYP|nr:variant surface glycoprotein 1646 [Trypanosoma brucei]